MNNFGYQNFSKKAGFLALGICLLIVAISNLIDPPAARPSGGRWGWLFGLLWDWFGAFGGFYYFLTLSVIFFLFYFKAKK
jgi:hypothetical protein